MILLVDTSQETGWVALENDGKVLFAEENKIAKEHAAWLHQAIGRLLEEAKMTLRDLKAVGVVAGPGSYTGLRVGMAAAKGFCYALKIPLITLNTLLVMAESMRSAGEEKGALICPMIDARRDEVFTAVYGIEIDPSAVNRQLPTTDGFQEILPPQAMILDKTAFEILLSQNTVLFFGSGATKWEKINESPSALFEAQGNIIQAFAKLTRQHFTSESWADPVYSEPVYLKEFFSY
jgi:tRNA threonylcarbamoyladenosine biosynthesis protein TsaB